MERNTLLIGLAMLIVGLFLGYAVAPSYFDGRMGYGGMMGGAMQRNIDRHFIEQMIPHHEGAIAMARVALERSTSDDVRSLAQGIIEAQEMEIESMHDWYRDWYGIEVPEDAHGGMMHMDGMSGDLDVLRSVAAADFDREFLSQMIPHHEMAIMMALMLQAGTEREEMKTLADQIITSQAREIEMMRGWLSAR